MPHRPLRLLHLLLAADPGGLSRYVIDLSNAMAQRGHEIIVAADTGEHRARFEGQGFRFVQIPLRSERLLFGRSVRIIRSALGQTPPDLIHTHYRRATLLARKLQNGGAPPILYTVHLSHISLRFPRNLFSDFGDHTHIASEDARQWCVQRGKVPNERITCIPHGVDVDRFSIPAESTRAAARRQLQVDDGDLLAAFVGRLEDPKNESWLIDLAAATRAQLPHLRLMIAGAGPNMPAVRQRIDEQNLHDRVRLLGEIDPLPLYHAADALLLPSAREGFSLVCAEAMSCGIPVLRTRTTGTSELIVENVTGQSTPIDRDAFIAAAIPFLSSRAKLQEMGRAAAERVRARFTFDRQVADTLSLYARLAAM